MRGLDDGLSAGARDGSAGSGTLFLHQVRLDPSVERPESYPFTLPAVRGLAEAGGVGFDTAVTFVVGHNGSGKSTLVEAIATALGFNPEGGSKSFRFSTAATHSTLTDALVLRHGSSKPRTGFFLRAESFYNVASEIDRLDAEPSFGPPVVDSYGGVSLHEQSHGESFMALLVHRFGPRGLYLLDEPEAALSPQGAMAALARIHQLAGDGAQFIIATHSPILLAVPGATILEIEQDGHIERVDYDDAMPVAVTRAFLSNRGRYLHELLDDDTGSGDRRRQLGSMPGRVPR